jgi:sugar lactone lactonase YvrE
MTLPRRAGYTNIPARLLVPFTRVRLCRPLLSSLLLLCMAGLAPRLHGQTAHFTSVSAPAIIPPTQSTLPFQSGAGAVAADSSGNVFLSAGFQVLWEKPTQGAGYTVLSLASGMTQVGGVAVDRNGYIYWADISNNEVWRVRPGYTGFDSVPTIVDSGLNFPFYVAVDNSGNVYVADTGNHRVLMETNGGRYDGAYTRHIVDSELPTDSLAADGSGNVYVLDSLGLVKETPNIDGSYTRSIIDSSLYGSLAADSVGNVYIVEGGDLRGNGVHVIKETPGGAGYTQNSIAVSGLYDPTGVAVDGSGNLYINNSSEIIATNGVIKVTFSGGADFGSVQVGAVSSVITLTFTFDSAGSIGAPAVVTQGAPNLDFTDAGTGTCTSNGNTQVYAQGDTCTVDVLFKPAQAGPRNGAVNLLDSSGHVIASEYIFGTGVAPQIAFIPPALSTLPLTSPSSIGGLPLGVAVDSGGNIYIPLDNSFLNSGVLKETLSGANPSSIGNGLLNPAAVAVDGGGNVYIADSGNHRVLEETLSGGSYTQSTIVSGSYQFNGVAVDGSGNVYIAYNDSSNSLLFVLKETPSGGSYTPSLIASHSGAARGVAVDGSGKVYVVDTFNQCLRIETPSGGGYTETTITPTIYDVFGNPIFVISPVAAAVDGGGNIYIAGVGIGSGNTLLMESPSAGSYTLSLISSGFSGLPLGMALDGSGNVYIADGSFFRVQAENLAVPPSLSFAATNIGSQSSDSPQAVTVANIGNADLSFPVPASGSNPAVPSGFSLASGTNCPQVSSSSFDRGVLAAGSAPCTYDINFVPTVGGLNSGSLILTDNNLNAANATQSIGLSGTGTGTAPSITSSPVSQTANAGSPTPVILTAAASGIPTPTVQWMFSVNGGPFTPVPGATSTTLSFIVSASMNGYQYEAVFTNTFGTATTSVATLTVDTLPTVTINPTNQGAPAGSSATFTAAASGNPSPTVQWQVSANGGGFTNIPNATSTTLIITGITDSMSGNQYRAVFTNIVGSATTSAGTLTVGDFTITATPSSQTISAGHSATYTINLASVGGLAGNVAVTCSGGPPKSTCTVTPGSVMLNGKASGAVTLAPGKNVGTFTLTFSGSLAGIKHSANVTLTIK